MWRNVPGSSLWSVLRFCLIVVSLRPDYFVLFPVLVRPTMINSFTSCNCPAGAGSMCKHICAIAYFINNEDGFSKINLPQQWSKPSKSGQEKYKKDKTIKYLFPNKWLKSEKIELNIAVDHQTLIEKRNILGIHCSLSTVLKEKCLSATERECKKCISFIIDQLEFDFTVELNQIHLFTILYAQKLNMTSLNLNIFPLDLKVHNFYYLYIKIDDSKMIQVFNSTISQSNDL